MYQRQDRQMREDDGHTIADMSGVVSGLDEMRRAVRGGGLAGTARMRDMHAPASGGDVSEELHDSEERLMVVLGTLKAALGIGMVYVVVFGFVIALMVLLWT